MISTGAAKYKSIGNQSGVEGASPHRLIQMLINGALERIHSAKGLMERGDVIGKGKDISSAISIIGGLRSSLNMKAGGEISANLDSLYEYMGFRLFESNRNNDINGLDEVSKLMLEVKTGWDGIEETAKH
ncbi:MAG: flagellar export chaperone FliS [Gammaproteobacteria bacterium CG22_combo_CG10-13_8_21_14_all_40_8]|nr:MAG: flagellar export chaperone FliS [Gammaproteobacteria bacterium CG22_combo_CG10-13_8_21_14_all_40_8]